MKNTTENVTADPETAQDTAYPTNIADSDADSVDKEGDESLDDKLNAMRDKLNDKLDLMKEKWEDIPSDTRERMEKLAQNAKLSTWATKQVDHVVLKTNRLIEPRIHTHVATAKQHLSGVITVRFIRVIHAVLDEQHKQGGLLGNVAGIYENIRHRGWMKQVEVEFAEKAKECIAWALDKLEQMILALMQTKLRQVLELLPGVKKLEEKMEHDQHEKAEQDRKEKRLASPALLESTPQSNITSIDV